MAKFGWTTDEDRREQEREAARERIRAETARRLWDPDVLAAILAPEDEDEEADAREYVRELRATRLQVDSAAEPERVPMPDDLPARRARRAKG